MAALWSSPAARAAPALRTSPKYPDKVIKVPIDINAGITEDQAAQVVDGLEVSGDKAAAVEQVKGLYNSSSRGCTMVE